MVSSIKLNVHTTIATVITTYTDFQPIKNWSLSDDQFDFLNFQIIIDVGIYKLKKC